MPGDVLLIEGLGSARSSTEPARIVRWVVPPASKPKPPPRAKLVAARPERPCLALKREADEQLRCTEENGLNSRLLAGQQLQREPAPRRAPRKPCKSTTCRPEARRVSSQGQPMPREPGAVRWPPKDGQPEAEQPWCFSQSGTRGASSFLDGWQANAFDSSDA